VKEFGIELTSGRFLLDVGETGDAVERIGLYSEPGIEDLVTAAGTDPVRTRMQGRECLLDPAKLFDGGSFMDKAISVSCSEAAWSIGSGKSSGSVVIRWDIMVSSSWFRVRPPFGVY
jgi:hypothetical protein